MSEVSVLKKYTLKLFFSFFLISCSIAEAKNIKYFLSLDSLNIYSLDAIEQFKFEISSRELENYNHYYEVHYKNSSPANAIRISGSKILGNFEFDSFDSKDRISHHDDGSYICKWRYGKQKKESFCYEKNGKFAYKLIYDFKDDLLAKRSKYNESGNLVEYSILTIARGKKKFLMLSISYLKR